MERWSIYMHKEYFKFSCAHFLIFLMAVKNVCTGIIIKLKLIFVAS